MKSWERLFVGTFGALLLSVGLYAVSLGGEYAVWRYLGGATLFVLGLNAVYGAVIGKRPWISGIGPMP